MKKQPNGNSKMRNVGDLCLAVKGHGMKTRSSKFKMSWKLEEAIYKVIEWV